MSTSALDVARLIDDLPGVKGYRPIVRDAAGYAQQAAAFATTMGSPTGVAHEMLGLMAAAAGPVGGPLIAAGSAVVSVFASLFGSDPPPIPEPTIGGQDFERFLIYPFANLDSAIIAGKVISGAIGASRGGYDTLKSETMDVLADMFSAVVAGRTTLSDPARTPITPIFKRRVAFFLVYAGHKYIADFNFPSGARNAWLRQAAELVRQATPRVQLRELLTAWFFYRIALGAYVATAGRPGRGLPAVCHELRHGQSKNKIGLDAAAVHGWRVDIGSTATGCALAGATTPVPGFVVPFTVGAGEDYPHQRQMADGDLGYGVAVWRHAVVSLVLPEPIVADDGSIAFAALDADVIDSELRKYYTFMSSFSTFEGGATWTVEFPRIHGGRTITPMPETWTEAVKYALELTKFDTQHVARVIGLLTPPKRSLAEIGAATKKQVAKQRVKQESTKKKKQKAKLKAQSRAGFLVAGGVAVAVAAYLLVR